MAALAEGFQVRLILPLPPVAVSPVGAAGGTGAVPGVVAETTAEGALVPAGLAARTR